MSRKTAFIWSGSVPAGWKRTWFCHLNILWYSKQQGEVMREISCACSQARSEPLSLSLCLSLSVSVSLSLCLSLSLSLSLSLPPLSLSLSLCVCLSPPSSLSPSLSSPLSPLSPSSWEEGRGVRAFSLYPSLLLLGGVGGVSEHLTGVTPALYARSGRNV